jgi:uncharacterized phage-associated protein
VNTGFDFKPEKFASATAYLAERKQGVTKKELCKLLYFADKRHLLRYGRSITGDRYFALEQGPIPSKGLDALNGRGKIENVNALRQYGKLRGWTFELEHPADLKALSKSDIAVLDQILEEMGHLKACQLEELSHREPAWRKAEPNTEMDFADFFEGHPEAELVKQVLLEEQPLQVV